MDDLITEFLTETSEALADLDNDLVNLEQNPNDKDLLSQIFRIVHTIKGTCGFLGLPRLEGVAHKGEDVLGLFRDGALEVTPEYVTLIFECLDCLKGILQGLEENGSEPQGDDSALIGRLEAVYKSANGSDPTPQEELDKIVAEARAKIAEEEKSETAAEEPAEEESAEVSLDELEAAFLAAPGPEENAAAEAVEEEKAPEATEAAPPPPPPAAHFMVPQPSMLHAPPFAYHGKPKH